RAEPHRDRHRSRNHPVQLPLAGAHLRPDWTLQRLGELPAADSQSGNKRGLRGESLICPRCGADGIPDGAPGCPKCGMTLGDEQARTNNAAPEDPISEELEAAL